MTNKMLSALEVHGFRAFEHLKLEKLGRVNLIVGKNNVGKSTLLEALWVYANQGAPSVLWSLLVERNESEAVSSLRMSDRLTDEEFENQILAIRYLFFGRQDLLSNKQSIVIGSPNDEKNKLTIAFTKNINLPQTNLFGDEVNEVPALSVQVGPNSSLVRLDRSFARRIREFLPLSAERKSVFVPANGLNGNDISRFWDNITLGALEQDALDALRIIEPKIERVNLIGAYPERYRDRVPIVKISDFDAPLPLRSLGEGMNRMFGIALAMVNAKGGMLLIDEVESGLHYSVHPELWRFIFGAAKRLDVQVFATTHSWDCIFAFQQMAQGSEQDGLLIRLENKKGQIKPTLFDEKDLEIATRDQIEVR